MRGVSRGLSALLLCPTLGRTRPRQNVERPCARGRSGRGHGGRCSGRAKPDDSVDSLTENLQLQDIDGYNFAITAFSRMQQIDQAQLLLHEMREAVVTPNARSFSTVVSACERADQWQCVLSLLQQMRDVEQYPSTVCFSAAISACQQAKQWQEALSLFYEMPEVAVPRDIESFSSAILACQVKKEWHQALWILNEMNARQVQDALEWEHLRIPIQHEENLRGEQFFEHSVDVSCQEDLFRDVKLHLPEEVPERSYLLERLQEPSNSSLFVLDHELFHAGLQTVLCSEHRVYGASDESYRETWLLTMKYFRAIEKHLREQGLSPQEYDILMGFSGMRKQSNGFPQYHVDNPELEGLFQFLVLLREFDTQVHYHPMVMSRWNEDTGQTEMFFDAPYVDESGRNTNSHIGQYLMEMQDAKKYRLFAQFNTWFVVSGVRKLEHHSSFEEDEQQVHVFPKDGRSAEQDWETMTLRALMFNAWARRHRGMPVDDLKEDLKEQLGAQDADEVEAIEEAVERGRSREMRFIVVKRV